MMPLVSVIIPTYNAAGTLPRAISSVRTQTYANLEIIVVDDGSTDDTESVVQGMQTADNRVRFIKEAHSGGAARPKNSGLRVSVGEFIATLDADDEWLPTKIERQMSMFVRPSTHGLGFVGCDYFVHSDIHTPYLQTVPKYADPAWHLRATDYLGPGSCILYRKSALEKVGGFDERLETSQDWEVRIRLSSLYEFMVIHEPLVRYYIHEGSVSSRSVDRHQRSFEYIYDKHRRFYEGDNVLASQFARYRGTHLMRRGAGKEGTSAFLTAIGRNPANYAAYALFLLSLLGPRAFRSIFRLREVILKRTI